MREIVASLKAALEETGELAHWGAEIAIGERPAAAPPALTGADAAEPGAALERLRTETIGDCHLCALGDTRKNIVFGVGNPSARILFVGEGPGFDEDRMGEPFRGAAGQLLDKILAAIQLDRTKVYIANIVKCHPMIDPARPEQRMNDRPPNDEEMAACLPFLLEQIRIVRPAVIVTLGATATRAILNTQDGIGRLRGRLHAAALLPGAPPVPVLPTYHPAALLRDPALKRPVWEDMKLLKATFMG